MGDHSVREYLHRRTTDELDQILVHFLGLDVCDHNRDIILLILNILQEREEKEQYQISQELMDLYRRLYAT